MLQALFERETPLGPDRLRGGGEVRGGGGGREEGGEGGGGGGGVGGHHHQKRAGTCPVLRVCHPQLEHRPAPKLITELYSYDCERGSTAARNMNKRDEVVLFVRQGKMMNRPDRIISEQLGGRVIASVNQIC